MCVAKCSGAHTVSHHLQRAVTHRETPAASSLCWSLRVFTQSQFGQSFDPQWTSWCVSLSKGLLCLYFYFSLMMDKINCGCESSSLYRVGVTSWGTNKHRHLPKGQNHIHRPLKWSLSVSPSTQSSETERFLMEFWMCTVGLQQSFFKISHRCSSVWLSSNTRWIQDLPV